jgi:tetratricopeptide (TPR) repeat protein
MKGVLTAALITLLIHCGNAQMNIANRLLQLETTPLSKSKFYLLEDISTFYYQKGESDSMLPVAQHMLNTAQLLKSDSFLMASYKHLGNCSYIMSDFVTAIQYYFQGVHLGEDKPNLEAIRSVLYNNIGENYNKIGYYEEALKYFRKALSSIPGADSIQKSTVYANSNLAETYLLLDSVDIAFHYLRIADEGNQVLHDAYIKPAIDLSFGMAYSRMIGDSDIADNYFKIAIHFSDSVKDYMHLTNAFYEYAFFLLAREEYAAAKYYGTYSLERSRKYNYKSLVIENTALLGQIYDDQGRRDSAYYFSRLRNDLTDSLAKSRKKNQIIAMTFNEDFHQKNEEAKLQEEADQRKINIQYFAIAMGITLFIIFFLVISHSMVANERFIVFLGEVGLLITFEFINLLLHPSLERITDRSPSFMLILLVIIASVLVPFHHYLKKFVKNKLVQENRRIRIEGAKKILREDEGDADNTKGE